MRGRGELFGNYPPPSYGKRKAKIKKDSRIEEIEGEKGRNRKKLEKAAEGESERCIRRWLTR